MFKRARFIPMRGYFVDTNIMITFETGLMRNLNAFIQCPEHRFFYTETVREEFQSDKYFTFVQSSIKDTKKVEALDFFHKTWIRTFEGEDKKKKNYIELTSLQLEGFRRDLLVII
jgi:hypothetical protein